MRELNFTQLHRMFSFPYHRMRGPKAISQLLLLGHVTLQASARRTFYASPTGLSYIFGSFYSRAL
jgi:hypothetical protein